MAKVREIVREREITPDNRPQIAIALSVIALILSALAFLNSRAQSPVAQNNDDLRASVARLQEQGALAAAQTRLAILRANLELDPVNTEARTELAEIRADLEKFSNDPSRELLEEWKELQNDLSQMENSLNQGGDIRSSLDALIRKIQQELRTEDED